ncbi:MAG: hypothetical protein NWF00_04925 [Candidatus Bathyarchaeota archaeon]|nr:hypothetical protein [Candidatus Bathyarchaeota archaeon]
MNKQILKTLESCKPGDLISVDWCDASAGKSSQNGGMIDVPVRSWGVYLGLMGVRAKQIVLAQNSFRYVGSVYDLDYTAIPVGMALEVQCIQVGHLPKAVVDNLLRSFVSESVNRKNTAGLQGLRSPRMLHHKIQQRLSINGGLD